MSDEGKWSGMCAMAKKLRNEGDLEGALELYRKALEITPNHEKLLNLVNKIESHLSNSRASMVHLGEGFYLSKGIYDKLYNYQRNGVLFLFKLFKSRTGGILGDDMGLGKTVQVCSFLAGMFDSQRIKNALIVVPPPLISNWENELTKWTPGLYVAKFHECTKREKERVVDSVKRRGGVCLTSYNTYTTSSDLLGEIRWDYCILDEGHKIKNHQTKTAKSLHGVRCPQRLILTGTPIMNSLKELWSLYDWTHQGQLLGTLKTFTEKFENPIVRARQKDATFDEKKLGEAMSSRLNELISPFLLRRLKDTIKMEKTSGDSESNEMPKLTKKNDLICWIKVSDDQEKVYRAFLTSDEVKGLLNSTRSPLVALTMLKKICDHPRLLSNQKCKMLGVSEGVEGLNEGSDDEGDDQATFDIKFIPNHILTKEAGKMSFLFGLLDRLRAEKHKCLVFSQSRRILDIIEKVISEKGYSYCRLDGRVRLMAERQQIIDRFQTKSKYQVFLLTTKVGGVGLTLTAADRVIIYDPSWNPSTDAQAVDRAFRIGQKLDVVIYRLITCGTVEEKIYRRQVYKDSICKKTLQDSKNPFRHFSKQDLFQLFELDNLEYSETQKNLSVMFQGKRNTSKELETHISFLHTLDNFRGISDHDLLFSKDADDDDDVPATNAPQSSQYVDGYVSQALEKLNLESEENRLLSQQLGHYVGGGVLEGKSRDVNPKKSSREGEFPNNLIRSAPRKKYAFPSDDEDEKSFNGDDEKDDVKYKDDDDDDDDNHHDDEDEDDQSQDSSHNSSREKTEHTDFSRPKHYKNVGSSSDEDDNDNEDNRRSFARDRGEEEQLGEKSRLHTSRGSKHQVSSYSHHDTSSKSINRVDDDNNSDENDNNDNDHSTFGEKIKSRLSQKSINNNVSVIPDTDDDGDELKVIEEDVEADDVYIEDTDEEQQGAVSIHSMAGNYASYKTRNSKSRKSLAENLQSQDILESSSNRQRNASMHNGTRQSESWLVLSSDEEVDPDDYENSELRDDKNDPSEAADNEGGSNRGDDEGERMSFEDQTSTLNTDASTSRDITGRLKSSNGSTVRDASHITEDDEESDVEDEEYDKDRDDDDDGEEEVEKSSGDVSQGNVDQTNLTNEMHKSYRDADDDNEEQDDDLCDESKNDVSRTTGKDNIRYTSSRVDETADYTNTTADYTNRTSEMYESKNAIEDEENGDGGKSEDSDDEDDVDVSHLTENKPANNSKYTASRIDDAATSTNKTDEMFESSHASCDEDENKDEWNKVTDDEDEENKDMSDEKEEDDLDTEVEVEASYIKRKNGARKSIIAIKNESNDDVDEDDDDKEMDDDGEEMDDDGEEMDDSMGEIYVNLLESAKDLCKKGELREALNQFEEAYEMYPEEEQDRIIPLTIAKLKERLGLS